jgi:hypothetical protein
MLPESSAPVLPPPSQGLAAAIQQPPSQGLAAAIQPRVATAIQPRVPAAIQPQVPAAIQPQVPAAIHPQVPAGERQAAAPQHPSAWSEFPLVLLLTLDPQGPSTQGQ